MYRNKLKKNNYSLHTNLPNILRNSKYQLKSNNIGFLKSENQKNSMNFSGGKQLDTNTMNDMNSRFNFNFKDVRVHDDSSISNSAEFLNAKAYTSGNHIVFGQGQYRPATRKGKELLAHELAHVVQNTRYETTSQTEKRAEIAMKKVTEGKNISHELVGGASTKFHLQKKDENKKDRAKKRNQQKMSIPPDKLMKGLKPATKKEEESPEMPSRIPIPFLSKGRFSLGLRLGFPKLPEASELQTRLFSGHPDVLKESLNRAKIINQVLTGEVPSGWQETDKGEFARAVWGIFSTNIAPDLAKKITSGLTMSTGPGGPSFELDLILITDFSSEIGGGVSFTVKF